MLDSHLAHYQTSASASEIMSGPPRTAPHRYSLEANMKTILTVKLLTAKLLAAALVLGICGLAVAEGEKADPVGTWQCSYEIGGQKRTSTLTVKKEDKLVGTMSWPDQKDEKI